MNTSGHNEWAQSQTSGEIACQKEPVEVVHASG